ncbi:MAG: ABC transporter ATP-binding protein [Planctomycetes bacterium]|nr:ABC transporter ATP-binding protein [Planctomycetota bacterium]
MISIERLEFAYRAGGFVLRVPELTIERGERIAIIGPSGTGKTTLLHLMAGILAPHAGTITVGGTDLTALDDTARRAYRISRLGLVFQEFELIEYLGVLDNILLPYRLSPALRLDGAVRDRAADLARRVGIGDKLRRSATRLSQGEKQRVAVCRALLVEPDVLMADEPTGNLDPDNTHRVLDILHEQAREVGATLVTVTHDHAQLDRFERVVDLAE